MSGGTMFVMKRSLKIGNAVISAWTYYDPRRDEESTCCSIRHFRIALISYPPGLSGSGRSRRMCVLISWVLMGIPYPGSMIIPSM